MKPKTKAINQAKLEITPKKKPTIIISPKKTFKGNPNGKPIV